ARRGSACMPASTGAGRGRAAPGSGSWSTWPRSSVPECATEDNMGGPVGGPGRSTSRRGRRAGGARGSHTIPRGRGGEPAGAPADAVTQRVRLATVYEEGRQGAPADRWVRRDHLRLVGADELAALAEAAGLVVESLAGDYDLEPLRPGSERAVLLAVKPG